VGVIVGKNTLGVGDMLTEPPLKSVDDAHAVEVAVMPKKEGEVRVDGEKEEVNEGN